MDEEGPTVSRRLLLDGFAAGAICAALPLLAGCVPPVRAGERPGPLQDVIDAHCHLFNGSDLPMVRFLRYVGLKQYPDEARAALDVEDPDFLDGVLALLTFILGAGGAPSAPSELRVLNRSARREARATAARENAAAVVDAAARFIDSSAPIGAAEGDDEGRARIRQAIVQAAAGGGPVAALDEPMTGAAARAAAASAYGSDFPIGRYLRWFALFTRYRHVLAEQLAGDYARQGFRPRLLAPAMVDYDHWLQENVDRSPLPTQVEVMSRIARLRTGPPIHGYVAYDPLRRAVFRQLEADARYGGLLADPAVRRRLRTEPADVLERDPRLRPLVRDARFRDARFDPLDLVRAALEEQGLMGVKVYPPMGFQAWGNLEKPRQTYPVFVDEKLGGVVGAPLNAAMGELYDLCARLDAPILAHAGASVGANRNYERRADPAYWVQVLQDPRWSRLRLCLAHFGGFHANSIATPDLPMPEGSWEWVVGRAVKAEPRRLLFADVSYMTEIVGQTPDRAAAYAATVRRYLAEFDPDCRHLVFGTDWVMVGRETVYASFARDMRAFFANACGLGPPQLERLFVGNAVRLMGLEARGPTRARVLAFYARHGVPASKLGAFDVR